MTGRDEGRHFPHAADRPISKCRTQSQPDTAPVRVLGCGRSLRRDDQTGLIIAARLERLALPGVHTMFSECPGADLLDELDGVEVLVVVDAASATADAPPGTWTRIDYHDNPDRLHVRGTANTHTAGLAAALSVGRQLGTLPPNVWAYVVAGADFGYGEGCSPAVERTIPSITRAIGRDVSRWFSKRAAEASHA